jgi:hypothetical protein
MLFFWVVKPPSSGLKMETVCFPETLLFTYESTRRHNPEEQHRHPRSRENLKSRIKQFMFLLRKICHLNHFCPETFNYASCFGGPGFRSRSGDRISCDISVFSSLDTQMHKTYQKNPFHILPNSKL